MIGKFESAIAANPGVGWSDRAVCPVAHASVLAVVRNTVQRRHIGAVRRNKRPGGRIGTGGDHVGLAVVQNAAQVGVVVEIGQTDVGISGRRAVRRNECRRR